MSQKFLKLCIQKIKKEFSDYSVVDFNCENKYNFSNIALNSILPYGPI